MYIFFFFCEWTLFTEFMCRLEEGWWATPGSLSTRHRIDDQCGVGGVGGGATVVSLLKGDDDTEIMAPHGLQ